MFFLNKLPKFEKKEPYKYSAIYVYKTMLK